MMNVEDALALAKRYRDEGVCSTPAKALIALLTELEKATKPEPQPIEQLAIG